MGYFSNGTESMHYETCYCEQCVHYGDEDQGCPIMGLHAEWNYEAVEDQLKSDVLSTFIPLDDDHNNEACKLFHPIFHEPVQDPNQTELFPREGVPHD